MAQAVGLPDPIVYSVSMVRLLVMPFSPAATEKLLTDAINLTRDKADKIGSALTAYPAGRTLVDQALARRDDLAVLGAKSAKLNALFTAFGDAFVDLSGIDYGVALNMFKDITCKLVSENVAAGSELAGMVDSDSKA